MAMVVVFEVIMPSANLEVLGTMTLVLKVLTSSRGKLSRDVSLELTWCQDGVSLYTHDWVVLVNKGLSGCSMPKHEERRG